MEPVTLTLSSSQVLIVVCLATLLLVVNLVRLALILVEEWRSFGTEEIEVYEIDREFREVVSWHRTGARRLRITLTPRKSRTATESPCAGSQS